MSVITDSHGHQDSLLFHQTEQLSYTVSCKLVDNTDLYQKKTKLHPRNPKKRFIFMESFFDK
jgi:hypothetical protein